MSSQEIAHNFALFGAHHIACGRVLHQRTIAAAPWLEDKMRGVASPIEPVRHVIDGARAYAHGRGLADPHDGSFDYHRVTQSADRIHHLAREYDRLPLHDPSALPHFDAMRREVNDQFHHLTHRMGIKAEFVDHDPYKSAHEMASDLCNNKRIQVLSTKVTGSHPFFSDEENDRFRAVHDAFGHAAVGRDFDGHGEEAAWHAHARMFSPTARAAMTTETRGQNGSVILHDKFGPQKIALMPKHLWTPEGMDHTGARIDDYRDLRDQQHRRVEDATGFGHGERHREEVKAFYGDQNVARPGHQEAPLTYKDFLQQTRQPREEEQAPHEREWWKGFDIGSRHGAEPDHADFTELDNGYHSSTHPDHFERGYRHGWESAVEQPERQQAVAVRVRIRDQFLYDMATSGHRRQAHVSGNSIDVLHCPFCGSGAVIARSDGTIECNFCTSVFTVQVQPQYSAFPMTTQGEPYPWPGQPDPASVVSPGGAAMPGDPAAGGFGGAPTDINADDAANAEADGSDGPPWAQDGGDDSSDGDDADDASADDSAPAKATVKGKDKPPFGKKGGFLTATGAKLDEDSFIQHLAIKHAHDPNKVAHRIRESRQ